MAKKASAGKPASAKAPKKDEQTDPSNEAQTDASLDNQDQDQVEDQDLDEEEETEETEPQAAEPKPFAYLVHLHQKNVIVVPSNVKGGANHVIKGGINTVPADVWGKVSSHPIHQAKLADGRMEVVAPILPGSDTVSELKKLQPSQCKAVIDGLVEEKTIKDWLLVEGRPAVQGMLNKQLERLQKEVTLKK